MLRAHGQDLAAMTAPTISLDRCQAVPKLIGRHEDFLIIAGLAGAARDVVALTRDGAHAYALAGAMGAAAMMGLGLALAQPERRILVVTGDGELLMNLGALATIAVTKPRNLAILCVDNGHYGETGYQKTHTSFGVDLERTAAACGIAGTCAVSSEAEMPSGARLLRADGPVFVLLRVKPTDPPSYKRNLDPSWLRLRFRHALLGTP
jgi:hypothetical protein